MRSPSASSQGFGPQATVIKVRQDDYQVNRQTEPLVNAVNAAAANPLVNSNLIDGVTFITPPGTATSLVTRVSHRLQHAYRGWFVVSITDPAVRIYEVTPNDRKADVLLLRLRNDVVNPGPGVLTNSIIVVVF